jgi:hypothetical protein
MTQDTVIKLFEDKKIRIQENGIEWSTICRQLKMCASLPKTKRKLK